MPAPRVQARPAATQEPLALLMTMGALAVAAAWMAVHLVPAATAWITLGGVALAFLVVFPQTGVYALAILCPFALSYQVGPLSDVRVHDGVLIALMFATVTFLGAESRRVARFSAPPGARFLALWCLLAVWGTITFLLGPANQWYLGSAVRNSWFVYRDVLRPMLVFPAVVLCLRDPRQGRRTISLLLLAAVGVAIYAIGLAMSTGENAVGPFHNKNELAGFLILVLPFVSARFFLEPGAGSRLMYGALLLVLLRGLWLTSSRGGVVAFAASLVPLVALVPRSRLITLAVAVALLFPVLIAFRGNLLERPMVKRFMTLTRPGQVQNFTWRQEQWRYFISEIKARPILGTGSDMDPTMTDRGRSQTAHNAYLALARRSGIPAVLGWIVLIGFVAGAAVRQVRTAGPGSRSFWVGVIGFVTALVVHNTAESILIRADAQMIFWMVAGVAVVYACAGAAGTERGDAAPEAAR